MVVSSGGGLGRVRLTLRSSELCCRAANWRERERDGGGGVGGGSVESDQWETAVSKLNEEGYGNGTFVETKYECEMDRDMGG